MIATETVVLIEKVQTGTDPLGAPIFEKSEVAIDNVVVGSPTFEASVAELDLSGKRIAFILGIPKGDKHNWKDTEVIIRGMKFKTFGFPLTQTDANVPTPWNTQVKVESYE